MVDLFRSTPTSDTFAKLTVADNGAAQAAGNYLLDSSGGPFTVTLTYEAGKAWELRDIANARINNVTLGTATDQFNRGGTQTAGPLVVNTESIVVEVVADPDTADLFHIHFHDGVTIDFTWDSTNYSWDTTSLTWDAA